MENRYIGLVCHSGRCVLEAILVIIGVFTPSFTFALGLLPSLAAFRRVLLVVRVVGRRGMVG